MEINDDNLEAIGFTKNTLGFFQIGWEGLRLVWRLRTWDYESSTPVTPVKQFELNATRIPKQPKTIEDVVTLCNVLGL